jgi:hypothetical protein
LRKIEEGFAPMNLQRDGEELRIPPEQWLHFVQLPYGQDDTVGIAPSVEQFCDPQHCCTDFLRDCFKHLNSGAFPHLLGNRYTGCLSLLGDQVSKLWEIFDQLGKKEKVGSFSRLKARALVVRFEELRIGKESPVLGVQILEISELVPAEIRPTGPEAFDTVQDG